MTAHKGASSPRDTRCPMGYWQSRSRFQPWSFTLGPFRKPRDAKGVYNDLLIVGLFSAPAEVTAFGP
jgi:hypothetical protein